MYEEEQAAKGGRERDSFLKIRIRLPLLCQIRRITWTNYILEAEGGQKHPSVLICGVVAMLPRAGFDPCHARRNTV